MCLKSHVWTNVFTGAQFILACAAFVSLMSSITRHSSLRRGGGGLGRGGEGTMPMLGSEAKRKFASLKSVSNWGI